MVHRIICNQDIECCILKMVILRSIFILTILTCHVSAYSDYHPASYDYTASNPTSQDSVPYQHDSYQNYIISRDDSYSGIDSYGVPVGEPLTPDPLPQYYFIPSAPVTELPTVPPPAEIIEPVLSQFAPLLILGCLVLFLWPTIVFVEVSDPERIRKEEENRTEVVTEELLAEVTEITESAEDTTTLMPSIRPTIDPAKPITSACDGPISCRVEQLAAVWRQGLYLPRASRLFKAYPSSFIK